MIGHQITDVKHLNLHETRFKRWNWQGWLSKGTKSQRRQVSKVFLDSTSSFLVCLLKDFHHLLKTHEESWQTKAKVPFWLLWFRRFFFWARRVVACENKKEKYMSIYAVLRSFPFLLLLKSHLAERAVKILGETRWMLSLILL